MIYDGINKKYVSIDELISKKRNKKNEQIIKLMKENNEKLDELIKIIKEVLVNGKGNNGGTESEASDSAGGATKTKTVD